MLESRPLADGVTMALPGRSVYVGARSSLAVGLPGPTTPATRVHFARSRRPYGSIGVLLAVDRQAFAAFENLALI